MHRSTGWAFVGRDGCACCAAAAGFLLAAVHGNRLTVRMVDRGKGGEGPRLAHGIPAFLDPAGIVVWERAFDSEATRQALEAWGVAAIPPETRTATGA